MAIVKVGKSGTFIGKIGDVVLARWKNKIVSKDVPTPSSKPKTVPQLNQQSRFKLVTEFFTKLSGVLAIGYQTQRNVMTPVNAAVQAHLKTAVTGVYPNYTLDFTKIMVTDPLPNTQIDTGFGATAVAIADAKVKVTWTINDPVSNAGTKPEDLVYLVFYNSNTKRFVLYPNKGIRSALTTTAQIPRSFVGNKFYTYMFFVSTDGKFVSETEQLGSFTLLV